MIALDEPAFRIQQVSSNAGDWLGTEASAALGRTLDEVLGNGLAEVLCGSTMGTRLDSSPLYLGTIPAGESSFQMAAHRRNNMLIVELEPVSGEGTVPSSRSYSLVGSFLAKLEQQETATRSLRFVAAEVRRLMGIDRVLVYKFDFDWNGAVIAQDQNDLVASCQGLHFPAGRHSAPGT